VDIWRFSSGRSKRLVGGNPLCSRSKRYEEIRFGRVRGINLYNQGNFSDQRPFEGRSGGRVTGGQLLFSKIR